MKNIVKAVAVSMMLVMSLGFLSACGCHKRCESPRMECHKLEKCHDVCGPCK